MGDYEPIDKAKPGKTFDPIRESATQARAVGCKVAMGLAQLTLGGVAKIPLGFQPTDSTLSDKGCEAGATIFGVIAKHLPFIHRDRTEILSLDKDSDGGWLLERYRFKNQNGPLELQLQDLARRKIVVIVNKPEQSIVYLERKDNELRFLALQPINWEGSKDLLAGSYTTKDGSLPKANRDYLLNRINDLTYGLAIIKAEKKRVR